MDPVKYKSIFNGFSVTLREDGVRGLGKGWAPTFIGYSMQGLCKFGFYEVFKSLYNDMLGEVSLYIWDTNKTENEMELIWVCKDCSKTVNLIYFSISVCDRSPANLCCLVWSGEQENAYLWRTSVYLAASASAEFFADIALAPMEACKVRIQTQPGYANTLRECAPKMHAEEGLKA